MVSFHVWSCVLGRGSVPAGREYRCACDPSCPEPGQPAWVQVIQCLQAALAEVYRPWPLSKLSEVNWETGRKSTCWGEARGALALRAALASPHAIG